MSRDMKPRRRRTSSPRKKSGGGTLIGLFVGLVIGVLCAAAVVWYIHGTPPPFSDRMQPAASANGPLSPSVPGDVAKPIPLPGKPGDPAPQSGDKPRFDFYKILPGNADAIPDPKAPEPKVADAPAAKSDKELLLKAPVYLQTGSFQNAADADNQKAKLAMMGVEAAVQQVMLQDKVWYRVRLGPFRKMEEMNQTRSDLARQGIEANVVK